jgi:putative transposase
MARVVIPGVPHHVTQRGNRGEDVFSGDADRRRYLALLGEYGAKHGLAVQAYCLMTNHVHLVVVPETADSLSATLKPVHLRHAQELNRRLNIIGILWQGRFHSTPLDEKHFWAAVRYVERNPVRAGMVERAWDYPWSSAAAHCGLRGDALLSGDLECADHVGDWQAFLQDEDDHVVEALRKTTRTGRPAGSEEFVAQLERLVGRKLRPGKAGRPTKRPPAS